MSPDEMKQRTKAFSLRVLKLVQALPRSRVGDILGRQLLRAGMSVGANYRAACRAKSRADFVNKLKIVEEECDEARFWMEILAESGLVKASRLAGLMSEGDTILAIVVASAKTARASDRA
jgi:four helix bundle protein